MAAAFCVPAGLGAPSFRPSLVGECFRCFGDRRDVSTGRWSHAPPWVVPLLIACSVVNQRANGSLPLADGEGAVGDPASEHRFSSLLFPMVALTLRYSFDG